MNYIISKGGTIARYTKSGSTLILRTPITKTLQPDGRAIYQVAGNYDKYGNPTSGFIEQNTYANVQAMGKECCIRALNPTANNHWTMVTNSHDPETCWYNGAFATSAPNLASTFNSCEGYAQFGAYHFTLPALPSDVDMTIQLKYTSGGACQCYQSAGSKSTKNKPIKGFGTWGSSWQLPFAVYTGDLAANYRSFHLRNISACNYILGQDILGEGSAGNFRGVRDLWAFTGTTRDGGIPTLTTPQARTVNLTSTQIGWFKSAANGVWIIPYFNMSYGTGASNYYPSYYTSTNGWWGCFSLWGVTLSIKIGS